MAIQLDQNDTSAPMPTAPRRMAAQPPRSEQRASRDSLLLAARQTLVQMRAGRRSSWLVGPRGGSRA